jgi:ATP-dependent Lon protease
MLTHGRNDSRDYPFLPTRNVVIFPEMLVPLFAARDKSIKALEHAMAGDRQIVLAAQKSEEIETPSKKDVHRVGVLAALLQLIKLPDGSLKALLEGKERCRITEFGEGDDFWRVRIEKLADVEERSSQTEALVRGVQSSFKEYAKVNTKISEELVNTIETMDNGSRLADTIAAQVNFKLPDKQTLLETLDLNRRLEILFEMLRMEIDVLKLEQRLGERVKKQMEENQKNYYLNEQMRAIQQEMGTKDDLKAEIEELEKQVHKKRLSKEARLRVKQELKKLKMMSVSSPEFPVSRNYIDWILSLPWYEKTREKLDIDEAKAVLDGDHHGLEKPKERILEYLAVRRLSQKLRGPILCLVGPPGVGKTSLAKSVAKATGRNFVRLSLGGVRDEAEIRGHRRTYVGALPGKIIQSLRKAKSNNPVFCMDEVDKMSVDFRGDPSAALLEVLDPEQNSGFNDHYLDLDYDLSDVLFITTANNIYNIPLPLQDRMEIIRLPGYTEVEKLAIAKDFLMKRQLEQNGLESENLVMSDGAIVAVIRNYTREAGVRNLERELSSICRKVAKEVVKKGKGTRVRINAQAVPRYLGVMQYRYGQTEEEDHVGLTTGLAWTDVGGELLQTEATIFPGRGNLILTGKLGEVMQESARAALSYIRSRARQLGLPDNFYDMIDIHVHVPEGAVPKDGPSAGITIAVSMVSALIRKPVSHDVAMTGEITLRGRVLPIGGLKEKILAAHRGGIRKVLIPLENKRDIEEIPKRILKRVELVPVSHVDEVLKEALVLQEGEALFSPVEPCDPFCPTEPRKESDTSRVGVTAH